jgi:hypothetical protein
LTPAISDQVLPGTSITYEVKTADDTSAVDSDYTTIKNYERLAFRSRRQVSNSAVEIVRSFKSFIFICILFKIILESLFKVFV